MSVVVFLAEDGIRDLVWYVGLGEVDGGGGRSGLLSAVVCVYGSGGVCVYVGVGVWEWMMG